MTLALAVQAASAAPILTFTPLTPTTLTLPTNSDAFVRYQVTNQAVQQHTFDVTPVAGIEVVAGAGQCAASFVLTSQQSCVLELRLVGSELAGNISGGPQACINGQPLQCYQPAAADQLHITLDDDSIFNDGFDA